MHQNDKTSGKKDSYIVPHSGPIVGQPSVKGGSQFAKHMGSLLNKKFLFNVRVSQIPILSSTLLQTGTEYRRQISVDPLYMNQWVFFFSVLSPAKDNRVCKKR